MPEMTLAYPEFVPNQILTDRQLNQLRTHLEQQDLLTRIRLHGSGIVCGLHGRTVSAPAPGVQVAMGYGVTSDGHLVELCDTTTYRHQRPYADPDRDEDGKLKYVLWRSAADPTRQLDIIELIPQEVMLGDDPPAADTFSAVQVATAIADRVLVLYLEHQPVDLNSCLVTSCDNKGRNINLHVRALLVKRIDLTAASGCADPPVIHRIPRLHTRGVPRPTATPADLTQAFADLVTAHAPAVSASIKMLFDAYAPLLNLPAMAADPLAGKLTGAQSAQYRYDALRDITDAYNEAAAAAYALVKECCPAGTFPRHLMLGMLTAAGAGGFRNEFTPAAARNVMDGEIERVCDLFKRLDAMIFALDLDDEASAVSVRPSHTAAYPLGRRARPFYFAGSGMNVVWRPRPRCTVDPDWPWLRPAVTIGLATDYTEATLLRIEGHIEDPHDAARAAIVARRHEANAEFHVLCSYMDDGLGMEKELRAALAALLETPAEALAGARDAFAEWVVSGTEAFDPILALAKGEQERTEKLARLSADWVALRARRRLHCDTSALAHDYLHARNELLCAVARARGAARRVLADVMRIGLEDLIAPGLEPLFDGVPFTLIDQLAAAVVADPDDWDTPEEIRAHLAEGRIEGPTALRLALVVALLSLDKYLQRLVDRLPAQLSEFDVEVLGRTFRRAIALSLEIWHWMRVIGLPIPGALKEPVKDSDAPLHAAEGPLLGADWLGLHICGLTTLAASATAYEEIRAKDVSLFRNLATMDGLEHLAGVSKGGTFVLVCDNATPAGKVLADFSLESPPPCCCALDADSICFPPLAAPDVRVVTLTSNDGGETYVTVTLQIPVTGNDCELNGAREAMQIELPSDRSDRGGTVAVGQRGVNYQTPENVRPGMIDRFSYHLHVKAECEGRAAGDVILIFTIAPVVHGRIEGFVFREDTGGRGDDAIVTILETGVQLMTSGSGDFAIEDVEAGRYTLRATQDDITSDPTPVEVTGGQTTFAQLMLKRPVEQPTTGTLIVRTMQANGALVSGATVALTGPVSRTGVTGATGVVQFANIPGGSYFATATKPGSAGGQAGPINLANGQTLTQNIFMQPIGIVVVPTEVVGFVAADRGVPLLEANAGVRKVVGDRYQRQLDRFNAAARDSSVAGSEPYAAAARFLRESLAKVDVTDEALSAEFEQTSSALAKAARDASGDTKTAYQEALAAVTGAYLDRVALANPESLPPERSAEIAATGETLRTAGLTAGQLESTWASRGLKDATGVRSTDAIVRLLQ